MQPDVNAVSPAEREARILWYWKAVELFSPQKVPRPNPSNPKEPVLRAGGETPLPWDQSRWFRAADSGRRWRFTAYCGLYKLSRIRSFLEHRFGRDPANFDSRPDGDSCLFSIQITAQGRPLFDTFVLASCPWAVGHLKKLGAKGGAWLNGLEAAEREERLRIEERFAVREDDEIGRALNRKPKVRVGRPIQPNELETEIERVANCLGVMAVLNPKGARLAARQIRQSSEFEAGSDDFLNSFFLRDLERLGEEAARSNGSAALSRFLSSEQDVHTDERRDLQTSMDTLWQNTSPGQVPRGRWPAASKQSLYFSQQFTVNAAFDASTTSTPHCLPSTDRQEPGRPLSFGT